MKTRIITALVATAVLFAALLCPYTIVLAAAIAAATAIAVWELLFATGRVTNKCLLGGCMAYAALTVMAVYMAQCITSGVIAVPLTPIFAWLIPVILVLLLMAFLILCSLHVYGDCDLSMLGYALWMTLYATGGFSALVALRFMYPMAGFALILLSMVIPWTSDIGAYFIGTFFGKHKMAPTISPKKSWEGFAGGWFVSIGASALYAWICQSFFSLAVNPLTFAIVASILAPLSVCGDLFASVIKRQSGIKDYGNILPGHGGIMDRFDSVVCIAPLLYILLLVL